MSGNIKKHYKHGFVTVDADMYRDKNLNLKERGMLGTFFSLPDDWNFSAFGLALILPESKNTINTILRSLESKGYLKRTRTCDEKGRVVDWFYDFYDYPAFNENDENKPLNTSTSQILVSGQDNPHPKNEDLDFRDMENWDDNLDNKQSNKHKYTIVSDSDSKNKIYSSEPSKNGSETESFIDDDTFLRNLTDEQYNAFEELLNRIKRRELNSSKASLIAYFKKLMQNSWKDSKGKEIKNIVGYVVMNFVSHDKDVHTAEIKLREQGFEPGSTVVPFKKETVRNKKEDILVEYDTSKNPEFNEERYNEIMSKRKHT